MPLLGLVVDGDSIPAGIGTNTGYPGLFTHNTGVPVINMAASGKLLSAMYTDYATQVAPRFSSTYNTLLITGVSNDIAAGSSAASIETTIQNYCAAARATGYLVYVVTCISRNDGPLWASTYETVRQTYNTWVRANWASFSDGIIDFDSITQLSNPNDTTYFQDLVHPTNLGASLMASYLQTQLGVANYVAPALWTPQDLITPPRVILDGSNVAWSGATYTTTPNYGSLGEAFTPTANAISKGTALNGLDTIAFSGTNFLKLQKRDWNGEFYVLAVAKVSQSGGLAGYAWAAPDHGLAVYPKINTTGSVTGMSWVPNDSVVFGGGFDPATYATPFISATAQPFSDTNHHLVSWRIGAATQLKKDGTAVTPSFSGNGPVANLVSFDMYVGSTANNSEFLIGDLAYFAMLTSPTSDDVLRLEGWAAWRWGLQGNLPVDHPYKSAAPLNSTDVLSRLETHVSKPILRNRRHPGYAGYIDSTEIWLYSVVDINATVTGVVATASPGNVTTTSSANVSIIGVTATAVAATVAPAITVFPLGVSATAFAGAVAMALDNPVSGVVATASAGAVTITASANVAITGVAATASPGTVAATSGVVKTITGVTAIASPGTVSITASANVIITGVAATAAAGTVTGSVVIPKNVPVTGVVGTASAGVLTITATVNKTITGVVATAAAGTATISAAANPIVAGVSAAAAAGTIAKTIQFTLTGAAADAAAGQVVTTSSANIIISGVAATVSAGTVLIGSSPNVLVTGVSASALTGIPTVIASTNSVVSGVAASASAGIVTAAIDTPIVGASANATAGTVAKIIQTALAGAQIIARAGNVTETASANTPIIGVSGAAQAGLVTLNIRFLDGAVALAMAGSLQVQTISYNIKQVVNQFGQPNAVVGIKLPSIPTELSVGSTIRLKMTV